MASISDFFSKLGWPELVLTLAICLTIFGVHGWHKIRGLFSDDTEKKKKKSFRTEE